MMVTVAELIVRYLQRMGIDTVFGMPGAHILPVYDRLYDAPLRSILVKHEQGAAFMACGYARVAGRIAACITTAGPGATNLVTGIANAYADKLPVLVITGEASTTVFGRGGLQESSGEGGAIDQSDLFRGITRYHKLIERSDYLPQVLKRASCILLSPAPGPVLLSFPFNVQQELVDDAFLEAIPNRPLRDRLAPQSDEIERLQSLITAAQHPLIIAGHGAIASAAGEEVAALAELLAIPVATSLKAKGVISESSPLALGTLGVTSDGRALSYLKEHADLVLFLGASYNERTSYLWKESLLAGRTLVQVDSDSEQLGKVFRADLAIHADIRQVLQDLLFRLQVAGVRATAQQRQQAVAAAAVSQRGPVAHPGFALIRRFFTQLAQHYPEGLALFDDNMIFAQNFFTVSSSNRYYPNAGVSSLGHAIPAAIGARFSHAGPTLALLGDGGFQMCCMELMTAVNYAIPLTVILFNNGTMGLIRKNQQQRYQQRLINCDFINPDYRYLARSFGIGYHKVVCEADIDELFGSSDFNVGIRLVEMVIDRDLFPDYQSGR
ncbi:MAG: thiamine pyrophosphate-binding protein [Gammaproteobacteria bacterium]|nr:thiamine pyrophosphate-binding protein [Gammaproteobacteria bacterium]